MNKQRQQASHTNDAHDIAPSSYVHLGGRKWVRRMARTMASLLVLQSSLSVLPAYAQTTASSSAPAGQRPILDASRNGVPIVHIAPPSKAGVSRNQYDQFNVNQNGLILNNSPTNVQTQQGGWISGNLQLGPTPARIILNEVVGANPSQLRGTIEVAGRRADIVIANPNGITCDGCGFLNADRASLTTGRPQFGSDGSVQGFDVRQGQLTIGGNGLNASNLEQLDLIARGIVIEGEIWAKNLNAIAGTNQVLYGTLQATAQGGTGTAPRFAIDIKDLGGMYANQVYMVATEQGLGVNSTGRIAALQGNLVLSANGDLSLQDSYAKRNLQIQQAQNVRLTGLTQSEGTTSIVAAGALDNQGTVEAQAQLNLNAGSINNTGTIAQRNAEGALLNAAGQISNSGTIYSAGQLRVDSESMSNSGGSLLAGGDVNIRANTVANNAQGSASTIAAAGNVNITGGNLANERSTISAGQDVTLSVSDGALSNQGGAIEAGRALIANAGVLDNRSGRMIANGTVSIQATSVDSADGIVSAGDRVSIQSTGALSSVRGQITSNHTLGITAASLDNTLGVVSANKSVDVRLGNGLLNNTQGQLIGAQALAVQSGEIRNAAGTIATASALELDTQNQALDNTAGVIVSSGDMRINSARFTNNGGTVASIAGNLNVNAHGKELNSDGGKLQAKENIALAAGAFSNRGGLVSGQRIDAAIGALNNDGGQLIAAGDLRVSSEALSNDRGLLQAAANFSIDTNGQNLVNTNSGNGGGIVAGGQLSLAAGNLDNQAGFIASNGSQTILVAGNIDNRAVGADAGQIVSNAGSTIAATDILNNGGRINALGNLAISGKTLDNRADQAAANGDITLSLATLDNRAQNGIAGAIEATNLTADVQSADNTGGAIHAAGDATLNAPALDNTHGSITATNNLRVTAANLTNSSGRMVADSSVTVNTDSRAPGGTIASAGDVMLTVNGDYANSGMLSANRNLTVKASNIDNTGTLTAGQILTANTGDLSNSGEISGQTTNLNATGTLNNTANGLIDGKHTNINAATTNNTGRIYGDVLRIKGATVNNTGSGAIAARDTLLIGAQELNNTNGGLIYSLGDLHMAGSLDASGNPVGEMRQLTNASARIEAAGNMSLSVANLTNRNDGLTTRTASYAQPVNKTLIQPNGSPHKFDVSELGWDPYFKDGKGRYVAPSSVYPFARFGAVYKEPAVTTVCGGGESYSCTSTHNYPPEHSIWSVFNVAPPYFGDLVKPTVPTAAQGNIWGPDCMMQIGDGGIGRSPYGVCGAYWSALDAYDATADQRTRAAESALDIKIVDFNADREARSFGEWYEYQITSRSVSETVIDTNRPAEILAGGQLTIAGGGSKVNDNSRIVAGGPVTIIGSDLKNLGIEGTRSVTEAGQVRFRRIEHHGGLCDCYKIELSGWSSTTGAPSVETFPIPNFTYAPFGGNQTANRNLAGKTAVPETVKAAVVQPGAAKAIVAKGSVIEAQVPGGGIATLFSGTPLSVPTNSLFTLHTEPNARYLVETDPRFTNYRDFLSSDYFLRALSRDPERQLKRYGDGFYEQQMVNDQILALTGRRYLSGYADTETEYMALMDAGVAFAKKYQLSPGVALSAEQMALLTTDVVWLTTQTVVLPNGQTERVLVPQVYLRRTNEGDLQTAGALIAGSDITIKTDKDLTNSGTIAGNRGTALFAGSDLVNQGGRIRGQEIYARAGNDLKNLSGVIQGSGDNSQVALLAGRDIVLQTRTIGTRSVAGASNAASKRTSIDRIATVQGGNVLLEAGRDLTAEGSAVKAEANLSSSAGRDIKVVSVAGGYELDIQRGDGKTKGITALAAGKGRSSYIKEESTTNQVATFEAGNDIALVAGISGQGQLSLKGVDVSAGNDAVLQGKSVTIEAAKDRQLFDVQNVRKDSRTRTLREDEALVGGNIVAGNKLTVHADGTEAGSGNVVIKGAYLSSKNDQATIAANNDVHVGTVMTEHRAIDESYSSNSGMFSTKTTAKSSVSTIRREEGGAITGNRVVIAAGDEEQKRGDITIRGSSVVADNDVVLNAGNNVHITTAQQTLDYKASEDKKTSGMFSGGGAGVTLGTQQTEQKQTSSGVTNVGSTVGSLAGNVSITAGNQYTQTGSQLNALKGDIDVAAKRIDINAATDSSESVQETRFKQSGVTLAVSSPLISSMQTMQQMGEASSKVKDPRMKAMAAANAGMAAKSAVDAAQSANGGGVSVSITVGQSRSESQQTQTSTTAVGSAISAGNNVSLRAKGDGKNSSITVIGSDIKAGNDASLKAEGDITLAAAQNTAEQHTTSSSQSAAVGVAISYGQDGAAFGVTASASAARGNADGKDAIYTNTHVDAGNQLTVESGNDTNIKGGVASGKQVTANVGGNFNIESLQDTSVYKSRDQSISASGTFGMGASGSVSASKSKVDADFASVTEQSSIKAGDGGFQVNVKGNTDLKGGVIASSEQAVKDGKNSLKTATLTQSDIENHDRYEASSVSFGASGSVGSGSGKQKADDAKPDPKGMQVQAFQTGMNGATAGIGSASGNKGGTTRSGISAGTLTITDDKKQTALTGTSAEQTVAATNRDVVSGKDSGAVAKDWNGQKLKEEVTAQAQITQAFSPMAAKEIGTYAGNKEKEAKDNAEAAGKAGDTAREAEFNAEAAKWAEGGAYRIALHAAAGGVAGGVGGALGAGASAAAAREIDKLQEGAQKYLEKAGMESDSAKAIAKGVAGATAAGIGAVAGGTAGAVVGMNVDVNNRQLHPKEINWVKKNGSPFSKELSKELGRPVTELEAERWLTTAGEANVDREYQRLASAEKGLSTSEESQAFNAAKQYIIRNGKESFVDDQGRTQQLFVAKNGDFYKPMVYIEYRNDKDYRDFYWEVKGDNLRPDNPTPEEKAIYEERERTRLRSAGKNLLTGAIPAVMMGATAKAMARGGSARVVNQSTAEVLGNDRQIYEEVTRNGKDVLVPAKSPTVIKPTESPLDWSRPNPKDGTTAQHVDNSHGDLRLDKPAQGVFYGNSTSVTNDAWRIAKEQGVQPVTIGNRDYYVIPRPNSGYAGGMGGQRQNFDYVTIITETNTTRLVTSMPSGNGLPRGSDNVRP
jgi:filamentous hemagglutinin